MLGWLLVTAWLGTSCHFAATEVFVRNKFGLQSQTELLLGSPRLLIGYVSHTLPCWAGAVLVG
jgi:hypothetical protein